MSVKQPIDTFTAEMRVLHELAGPTGADDTWLTPAFWTMAGVAVTNLITVAVLVGWIDATQAETLTSAAAALIGAAQVIIVNTALVWKFISGRNQVQIAKIEAKARSAESLAIMAVEQLRLARE
jgi:hypothetical protein